jgi:hypothetical protein
VPKLQPSPDALAASEAAAAALSDRWHAFVDEYPDLHSALNRDLQSTDFQVPT